MSPGDRPALGLSPICDAVVKRPLIDVKKTNRWLYLRAYGRLEPRTRVNCHLSDAGGR